MARLFLFGMIATMLCWGQVAAGQPVKLEPAGPAPLSAPLRSYTWEQAFPVTPPFPQWQEAGQFDSPVGKIHHRAWLRSNGVLWSSPTILVADVLIYFDPSKAQSGGYARAQIQVSCDFHYVIMINAQANVVIDPQGIIKPTSPVREAPGAGYPVPNSMFERLCTDSSFRSQFLKP